MKRMRFFVGIVAAMTGMFFVAMPAYAQEAQQKSGISIWGACDENGGSAVCASKDTEATDVVKNILNLLLFCLGIAAVALIIHSGLKYVTSRGDPANIKSAKDTLLYAVIGLIVASLSFVIVNFVIGALN